MHGIRELADKCSEIRKVHGSFRRAYELADRPFRLIDNFPRHKRRMGAEFFEEGKQNAFQQGFTPGREFQDVLIRQRGYRIAPILHPRIIDQRETQPQTELLPQFQRRGHIHKKQIIRSRRDSLADGEPASSIAEKKPAHEPDSRRAHPREISGDNLACIRSADTSRAPGAPAKILAVIHPGIVHTEQEFFGHGG